MTDRRQTDHLEIHRKSQELAVAWSKGRAAFVLDSLGAEGPLRAALIATLVYETLARWDPYDAKFLSSFRHALFLRSQGSITPEEVVELKREYRRRFGSSPPLTPTEETNDPQEEARWANLQLQRIRAALASGQPLASERPGVRSTMLSRARTAGPSARPPVNVSR